MTTDRKTFIERGASFAALAAFIGVPSAASADAKLRYACTGEVHKDFHASTLDGINYLIDNYGEESARRVLWETGTKVFRQMHEKLVRGDSSELIAWWRYYMDREGAEYDLKANADGTAVLTVRACPALRHLGVRGISGGERTCWATNILNEAFCSDSPFEVILERTGDCACSQTLRRRVKDVRSAPLAGN